MDLFGAVVLALVAGLGGGVLRGVLLGATPPSNLSNVAALLAATAAGVVAFYVDLSLHRFRRAVLVLDAGGLGLFTVNGAVTTLALGPLPLAAVAWGLVTRIGGGVLRDLLSGQVPGVLQDSTPCPPWPAAGPCRSLADGRLVHVRRGGGGGVLRAADIHAGEGGTRAAPPAWPERPARHT